MRNKLNPMYGLFFTISVFGIIAATGIDSHALRNCDSKVTFSGGGTVNLTEDYERTAHTSIEPCILLENGTNLDLKGYTIKCNSTDGNGDCLTAIEAADAGSVVKDTGASGGGITTGLTSHSGGNGTWGIGVENADQVKDLDISYALQGIVSSRAKVVRGNKIAFVNKCIGVDLVANTSSVDNNFCSPDLEAVTAQSAQRDGILANGTASGNGSKVERNFVINYDFGIVGGDGRLRINDNIVCNASDNDVAVSIDASESQTGSNNICCEDPVSGGTQCLDPSEVEAPFDFWP